MNIEAKKNIIDEAEKDNTVAPIQYNISSFGADYDVEGMVRRLNRGDIEIPSFQRSYVWSLTDASRFIESLLLGLPVPGVFLARDPDTKKLLVIDGQQRLKTLQFFHNGVFNPLPESSRQRVFKLTKVQSAFEGETFETLSNEDRRILNDSIIHATIVRQEYPQDDDTSIYHIFERLNTTGRKLSPQEIRVAIYHGPLINLLKEMNEYHKWREIFGKKNSRLKDQELILRFLGLYFYGNAYKKPMKEFLNVVTKKNRFADQSQKDIYRRIFERTIDVIHKEIGTRAFRPVRAIVTAVFDSVMIGVAKRITESSNPIDSNKFELAYRELLEDEDFEDLISGGTSDEPNVNKRIQLAIKYFAKV